MKTQLALLACAAATASATWTPSAPFAAAAAPSAKNAVRALLPQYRQLDGDDPVIMKASCSKGQATTGAFPFIPTAGLCIADPNNAAHSFLTCNGTTVMIQTSVAADCTGSLGTKTDYSAQLPDSVGNCVAGEVDGVKMEYYDSDTCGGSPTLVSYLKSEACIAGVQKWTCDASNAKVEMGMFQSECQGTSILSLSFSPDSCEKFGGDDGDDEDGGYSYGNTCPEKQYACEGTNYADWFEGGCQSCDEDEDPEDGKCSTLLPLIQKDGCYGECAVGWDQQTIDDHADKYKCKAGEIEKTLGRKSETELKKEMEAVGCGEKENYCGPAEEGGMTKDYIPEFEGACSSCTKGPADCKEAIEFLTTGCYGDCAVGMTPEVVAALLKPYKCTKAEEEEAQATIAAEQKAKFLSAGHSLLVNGFSLAALAAAAVYSAVC